ncbi:MAG: M23 family metallopeptidase [Pseudomonadota bacterium]
MKDYYAITVSDLSGSKHYTVRKTVKKWLFTFAVLLTGVMAGSFGMNYLQYTEVGSLEIENQVLGQKLDNQTDRSQELLGNLDEKKSQITLISTELIEIEKNSGVDTADQEVPLHQRIRAIGTFYTEKEEAYTEIGSRVEQIEGMIGLDKVSEKLPHADDPDLGRRVEIASLNASQMRVLHDSIPNGFPTDTHVITSRFGNRIHPISKIRSFHKGVDIRAKNHNPVFSTADGVVRDASFSDLSGNRIVVQHNFGFETRYSHLHKMHVKRGDVVHRGDLLGQAGNTGLSDAPHLHYEIRYLGKAIDPVDFLGWEFGSDSLFSQVRGIEWPSLISLINKQITHQTLQLSQLDQSSQEP